MQEEKTANARLAPRPAAAGPLQVSSGRVQNDTPSAGVLQIVWRRRWIVIAAVLVSLVSAFVYLSKAVPIYGSSSQIYIEETHSIINEPKAVAGNSASALATQCELIRSSRLLSLVVESPEVRTCRTLRGQSNPVAYLKHLVDVQVGKTGDILTVSAESPYADDAALLVNSVVDAFITDQNKHHRSTSAEVLAILQKEKDKTDKEFKATSDAMLAFLRDNGTLSFDNDKGNIVTQRLGELSQALTAAQMATLDCKLTVEAIEAMGDDSMKMKRLMMTHHSPLDQRSDPDLQQNAELYSQLHQLQLSAAQLRQRLGDDHPAVRSEDGRVKMAQDQIREADRKTVENYRAVIKQEYSSAQKREEALQKAFGDQQQLALAQNSKSAQYSQLQINQRRAEKTLDLLESRIKEINLNQDALDINNISILEPAVANATPVRPIRSQTLMMSIVVGLMAGLGAAMLQDWMDQRLRSADEIAAVLDLPILGLIPHIVGRLSSSIRGQQVHIEPKSDVAEAYRTVRTAIHFGGSDSQAKTLLVTSPAPGDGKTTAASNIAIAIAQAGRRVLLIDADCRKPMQHRIFNLNSDVGLSSILLGNATVEEAIQRSSTEHLDLLPCGPIPPNPSEILNSQKFMDLIDELVLRYDQIVIDSPPVVPVTDARILAASCDLTILVLRAEKSTRRMSEHARDALASVNANLLGVVVNDVPRNQAGYGYYSGYGYYRYGYGYTSRSSNGNGDLAANGNGHSKKEVKAITVATDA